MSQKIYKVVFLFGSLLLTLSCKGNVDTKGDQLSNIESATDIMSRQNMRNVEELINTEDSGFELVKEWTKDAKNGVEILPRDLDRAKDALFKTQVTTRSPMGAIVYETGGVLVKNGMLRILGSGNSRLNRSLPDWNKGKSFKEYGEKPFFFLIADDIFGGFFAINGGGLSDTGLGEVFYFAPDTLQWEAIGMSYSDFVYWCFHGDLDLFYESFLWNGYQKDLIEISGDQAVSFYPYLWTKEGQNVNDCSRSVVPIQEIWDFEMSQK